MAIFNFGRRMTNKESKITTKLFWITFLVSTAIYYLLIAFLFGLGKTPIWFSLTYDGILLVNLAYSLMRIIPHMKALRRGIKAIEKEIEELNRKRILHLYNEKQNAVSKREM